VGDKIGLLSQLSQIAYQILLFHEVKLNGIHDSFLDKISYPEIKKQCIDVYDEAKIDYAKAIRFAQFLESKEDKNLLKNQIDTLGVILNNIKNKTNFSNLLKSEKNDTVINVNGMIEYIIDDSPWVRIIMKEYLSFMASESDPNKKYNMSESMITHVYVLSSYLKEKNEKLLSIIQQITKKSDLIIKSLNVQDELVSLRELIPDFASDLDGFCKNIIKTKEIVMCTNDILQVWKELYTPKKGGEIKINNKFKMAIEKKQ
jgi:hypothetical protein